MVEAAAYRLQRLGGQLARDPHRIHAHRRQQRAELVVQLGRETVLRLAGLAEVAGEAGQGRQCGYRPRPAGAFSVRSKAVMRPRSSSWRQASPPITSSKAMIATPSTELDRARLA